MFPNNNLNSTGIINICHVTQDYCNLEDFGTVVASRKICVYCEHIAPIWSRSALTLILIYNDKNKCLQF